MTHGAQYTTHARPHRAPQLSPVKSQVRLLATLLATFAVAILVMPVEALAQRQVDFPPPDSQPPPAAKAPRRTQTSGEETSVLPDAGPTMRKTQERKSPPPTNLTVMYKVQYGETLKYVHPVTGAVTNFAQWESYKSDGYELIKHVNEELNDGNNYQYAVKPLGSDGFDPVDIPILYMTGDYAFAFRESEVENLRKFILDGGTIIFNASRGRDEFSASVVREMRRVFPAKQFMKAPLDHPVLNGRFRIQQVNVMINGIANTAPPEVYTMDIGTRAAAILVPAGLGAAWAKEDYHPKGKHIVGESAIRLGVNMVSYVLGSTEYGRFLAQEFPTYNGATRPGDVVFLAQARYAGAWNVNPALQNSVLQGLRDNTTIDVNFRPTFIDLDDTEIGEYPMVFMTGHYDFELTEDEVSNLRAYLNRGGVLFASAAAGLKPFDIAFRREMKKVLPDSEFIDLPPSHPLFVSGWNPIGQIEYTAPALRDDPTLQFPDFFGAFIDNRIAVIYTPYDLFSGLNRESNAYAKGVTSDDSLRIVINSIAHVMSH